MKEKARYGQACNNCGRCCHEVLCPLASRLVGKPLNADGPCPMLQFDAEGNSGCGVVKDPTLFAPVKVALFGVDAMREAAMVCIGTGFGCDAQIDGEPGDPAFKARMRHYSFSERVKVKAALRIWGVI